MYLVFVVEKNRLPCWYSFIKEFVQPKCIPQKRINSRAYVHMHCWKPMTDHTPNRTTLKPMLSFQLTLGWWVESIRAWSVVGFWPWCTLFMIIMYQIYVYKRITNLDFAKHSRIENNKKVHFILIWPMTQKSQICLYSAGKDEFYCWSHLHCVLKDTKLIVCLKISNYLWMYVYNVQFCNFGTVEI